MLQYDSKLYVQVLLSSLRYNSWNVAMRISTVCSGPLKFFTLQAPEMKYVLQSGPLKFFLQLYVQVLLSSSRYKLLKCCNAYLDCMFRFS